MNLKSPLGREYYISEVSKVPNTTKLIKGVERSHWRELIRYIDTGELVYLYRNSNNKVYKVEEL